MKNNQNAAYFKIGKKPTDIRIAAGKIIKNDIPQRKIFVSENIKGQDAASDNMITSTEQSLRELVEGLKKLDQTDTGFDLKTYSKVHISPLAKKIAEVEGLPLEEIPLTSGRIEKKDVLRALELRASALVDDQRQTPNVSEPKSFLPLKTKPTPLPMVQSEKKQEAFVTETEAQPSGIADAQMPILEEESATRERERNGVEKPNPPHGFDAKKETDTASHRVVETQLEQPLPEQKKQEDRSSQNRKEHQNKNPEDKTMLEAQSPIIQLVTEVDMTEIKELRKRISKKIETETGVKCTFTDFLLMSVAKALVEHPQLNGYYDDFQEQIVLYGDVQLGLSAIGDRGNTIFPTITKAQDLNFTQMLVTRNDLLKRVKKGVVSEEDQTPTFAIVNLGMYGILEFSSRIQDGNAAVLSVGKVVDRIRMVGNEETLRAVMRLNLNLDTRVCDGIIGAQFLKTVVDTMENPAVLLF